MKKENIFVGREVTIVKGALMEKEMLHFVGEKAIITEVRNNFVHIDLDNGKWAWDFDWLA